MLDFYGCNYKINVDSGGGTATPIVVAGWGIGGGNIAFGVADSVIFQRNVIIVLRTGTNWKCRSKG